MKRPAVLYIAILVAAVAAMIWVYSSPPLTPFREVVAISMFPMPWLLIPIVGPLARCWRRKHPAAEGAAPPRRETEFGWTVSVVIILAFIALFLGMRLIGHFYPHGD